MVEKCEKLRATLQELEAELAAIKSLDDETRSVLESVLVEIGDVLKRAESRSAEDAGRSTDKADESPESLATRLQEAAEEFETSHPTLFGIVSRTVDALGQMGI